MPPSTCAPTLQTAVWGAPTHVHPTEVLLRTPRVPGPGAVPVGQCAGRFDENTAVRQEQRAAGPGEAFLVWGQQTGRQPGDTRVHAHTRPHRRHLTTTHTLQDSRGPRHQSISDRS